MDIKPSKRVAAIGGYAFEEVDKEVAKLKAKGIQPIDFGVGDPTIPTPKFIRNAFKKAADSRARAGYPSYIGDISFRKGIAEWMKKRFNIALDPAIEITSTIGSKEGIFNFHEGILNPGDIVIIPTPGYPPYARGTSFAEGVPYFVPLIAENNFLPDLRSIPALVRKKAKLMWINYPNSPTGVNAPDAFFREVIKFGQKNNIIIASDEAYTEIYFGPKPKSILQFARKGVIAFFSMSKRSAMTCYRVGWAAGDPAIISIFKKVKTNIDSGTPTFIQDAAREALSDETHVAKMRQEYREKRDIMISAFKSLGLEDCTPDATLYIWQKVPEGYTSLSFAKLLLREDIAIVTTPGEWISETTSSGINPGKGYIRLALVPEIKDVKKAAARIRALKI